MQREVLDFWFKELTPKDWWSKNDDLDREIQKRFSDIHISANLGELSSWRKTAKGSLAEIIILDQFSRNIYRGDARSFSSDPLALCLSQMAIEKGFDKELNAKEKSFIYLPFMHSESKRIHEEALVFFNQEGLESNYKFEIAHKEIIDRFGRYPHRNNILNRESTKEELEFLKTPGSSF